MSSVTCKNEHKGTHDLNSVIKKNILLNIFFNQGYYLIVTFITYPIYILMYKKGR